MLVLAVSLAVLTLSKISCVERMLEAARRK